MLVNMFKLTAHTDIDHPFTFIGYKQNYNPLQKFIDKLRNQAKLDKTEKL